jgi:hypothetical protein
MSIASDTRTSVDAAIEVAVEQGKRALEAAQVSLGKLQHNVNSARSLDSITPNVDALRAAVEPLVATALAYTAKLSGRAESAVADLKTDKRIAQVLQTGEALATAVAEAVHERVGQAATTAAGAQAFVRSQRPGASGRAAAKPAPTTSTPTAAKPVRKPAATKTAPVTAAKTAKAATGAPAKPTATKATKSSAKKAAPAKRAAKSAASTARANGSTPAS